MHQCDFSQCANHITRGLSYRVLWQRLLHIFLSATNFGLQKMKVFQSNEWVISMAMSTSILFRFIFSRLNLNLVLIVSEPASKLSTLNKGFNKKCVCTCVQHSPVQTSTQGGRQCSSLGSPTGLKVRKKMGSKKVYNKWHIMHAIAVLKSNIIPWMEQTIMTLLNMGWLIVIATIINEIVASFKWLELNNVWERGVWKDGCYGWCTAPPYISYTFI